MGNKGAKGSKGGGDGGSGASPAGPTSSGKGKKTDYKADEVIAVDKQLTELPANLGCTSSFL